ncbi:hypothetical protein GGS23DRAFT_491046 [Durotheca rogersii]|uniref:uncharacterized protein n=1 Tax=Durotheca rogersii TaxID=419775 RepID=UPI0022205F6A|nr:uncharacterized protein GGS23DRAFT_491046 [Durotheca rogersii]KAI5864270.1 hypothetical protein GGS23DRAFT_491046 [Durotheca rogersii]
MPRGGVKRKAVVEPTPDELGIPLGQRDGSSRIKPDSKTKRRFSRLEEQEEDGSPTGGRHAMSPPASRHPCLLEYRTFQHWADILEANVTAEVTRSGMFVKSFEEEVRKETEKVRGRMKEQDEQLAAEKKQFVVIFEELYSATATPYRPPSRPNTRCDGIGKEGHALYANAQAVMTESHALLKHFKETDERSGAYRIDFPASKWKQDKHEIKELLARGREYGERLVEDQLAPDTYQAPKFDACKANEEDDVALGLFKEGHKASYEDSWGMVAVDQVKRLTAVANTIPLKGFEQTRP